MTRRAEINRLEEAHDLSGQLFGYLFDHLCAFVFVCSLTQMGSPAYLTTCRRCHFAVVGCETFETLC